MNFEKLKEILSTGSKNELTAFCEANNLDIKDGKLYHRNSSTVDEQIEYWDKRQLVKKINLNSLYGAILNAGCRFNDKRIGQSTTLTGRSIVKSMAQTINECIEGTPNHLGKAIIYGDTDSLAGDSIIRSNWGDLSIESLFALGQQHWANKDKEYSCHPDLTVASYSPETGEAYYGHINYIYRHKVSKEQWEIEDDDGNVVIVTGDHSVMIERNGELIEIKPRDIRETDVLITVVE